MGEKTEEVYFEAISLIEDNPSKAFKLMSEAAESGHLHAMKDLSNFYYFGIGCEVDFEKVIETLKSCLELPSAKLTYSEYLSEGEICGKDVKQAIKLAEDAYEDGASGAAEHLLWLYRYSEKSNNKKAFNLALKEAERENVNAYSYLYYMYEGGEGTKKNLIEAYKWLEKEYEEDPESENEYLLADAYMQGEIPKNYSKAAKFAKEGLLKGDQDCISQHAENLLLGRGIKKNVGEAISWYLASRELDTFLEHEDTFKSIYLTASKDLQDSYKLRAEELKTEYDVFIDDDV